MAPTNVQDAKVLISSTKVADRTTGLRNLLHVLKSNRGKKDLQNIGNKAYLALCETILQCMRDERSTWLRSKSKTTKTAMLLPLCASALRQVIIVGVRTMKSSTVEMIIESTLEILPGKDGALIKPLLEEIPKALRALLEYQPHVERLSRECWDSTVDFCIDALSSFYIDPEVPLGESWSSTLVSGSRGRTPVESADALPKTSSRSRPSKSRQVSEDLVHTAEDFVTCLSLLTKASNAPLLGKADAIISALIHFLQRKPGRGYSAALASINSVLNRILLHSIQLTKRTLRQLLPLIKVLWSDMSLRDEILITFTLTDAHLESLLANQHEETIATDLESLVEIMYGDYRRRQETAALQFLDEDHLSFRHAGHPTGETHPLRTYAFALETEHMRCEALWATVATIARFAFLLDERRRALSQSSQAEEEVTVKRPRITQYFQDYLRDVSEPRSNAKRAALQVVAFMVQEGTLALEDLQALLERLTAYIADENPVHSTWAMISLAAAACQESAKHANLLPYWVSAWQSASRAVTSVSSARAACHLMNMLLRLDIVPYSSVSETVQTMLTSIELSGPALLSESSSSFLETVLHRRVVENPTHFHQTAERILSWLFNKWTPSLFPERTYSVLNAHHCDARDVLRLVRVCLDRQHARLNSPPFKVLGPIGQTRSQTLEDLELTHYLLLLEKRRPFQLTVESVKEDSEPSSSERSPSQLEGRIIDYCTNEIEKTRQRWKEWTQQNAQAITTDMLRVISNFCIVATGITKLGDRDDRRITNLQSALEILVESFTMFLTKREVDQHKVDAVLDVCLKSLPEIRRLQRWRSQDSFADAGISLLSTHLAKTLVNRKMFKESFYAEEDDFMDIDEGNNSQPASGAVDPELDVPRYDIQARTDAAGVRASCFAYLQLIASLATSPQEQDTEHIPLDFINYLVSIPEVELLRARDFTRHLLGSHFRLHTDSCLKLLEHLGETLIHPSAREHNTSEVANGMVLEFLTASLYDWDSASTDRDAQDLYETVADLYAYYVKGMERNGVRRSINLQHTIASFLHGLLKFHPEFGQGRKAPSVRTSLFELLSSGEIAVKYHITELLPDIFSGFVLSEHDKILTDIDTSLPSNDAWIEGIAIRLSVFGRLAAQWHTLLRQGVYRIFATAGYVESSTSHAKRCIVDLAGAKKLEGPQALFRLFAPQIIFTWLDRKRKFSEIPFLAFNYTSLPQLLKDVESEAIGQAMMLGLMEQVEYLAGQLGATTSDVLIRNIEKAGAYTLSWDTCKGFARNKSDTSNAMTLRNSIGHDVYLDMIQQHFPRVLGYIFQTIHHEDRIQKSLEKRPAFASAAKALAEMDNISHSTRDVELGIEPSFSAWYLIDQLERLCRRTGADPPTFWTASVFTVVMRMLLDRIHPVLGSVYARSIIRKIKILVALAGGVAYEGYPLQMTLQSLRPFLTDPQCAEDTLGIVQYLFEHGNKHLQDHLGFVTGIGVSILISIRVFLGSSQDSTTQQSEHMATMDKARRFHSWFSKYLESYAANIAVDRHGSSKAFRKLTTAASSVRTRGSSLKGSQEGKLLLEILDDARSGRKLLNNTSREVALDLLCQNFEYAPHARDDILGTEAEMIEYAPQVWESCMRSNIGDGYLLWAGRVLGRAFSACGEVRRNADQSRPWPAHYNSSRDSLGKASRAAIIKKIVDLFYSDNREEVSLAEDVMRLLISRLLDESYSSELENTIPLHIEEALNMPLPQISTIDAAAPAPLESIAKPTRSKPVNMWIRDLAVSLCNEASSDPILGSLSKLLLGIPSMPERLLPYILHLVLIQEFEGQQTVRDTMSDAMMSWFEDCDPTNTAYVRIMIEAILYLRTQPTPKEVTRVDRDRWLEIDYLQAAQAATVCGMHRSALLFIETSSGQPSLKSTGRRSSVLVNPPPVPVDLQLAIYKNLDEPDSFYGVDRGSSLGSVLDRFDYEGDGVKSLLFRGARLDSQIRRSNALDIADSQGTVKSLITLNMNSITHSLLSNDQFRDAGDDVVNSTLHTARKLGQWDIKAPETNHSEASTLFRAFQIVHYATDGLLAREQLDRQLLPIMNLLSGKDRSSGSIKSRLRTLAVLAEMDEVITSTRSDQLLDHWDQMKTHEKWMRAGEFEDVRLVLSCRETLWGILGSNDALLKAIGARAGTARHIEVQALVASSSISRRHGALQDSLASVTYLSDIVKQCKAVGLDIEATAQHEVSNVLWDQGEAETSIRMRQNLIEHANFDSQETDISLPVLLAKLGHHIAEARLAKPDTIIQNYLEPAVQELKGQTQGLGPGQVFHEFALFCDKQLQNPEAAEDLARIKTVMEKKQQEYQEFERLSKTDKSKTSREVYRRNARRAQDWYRLDKAEYERLHQGRQQFLRQCLENYLLSLQASDEYNNDALRVFSMWLEHHNTPLANDAVGLYLNKVPSAKFALLMNQLSSRLQSEQTDFQQLLFELVFRICAEHPYHGMHHIFAIQMKIGGVTREEAVRSRDESAKSRQKAAALIVKMLADDTRARETWGRVYESNSIYHNLAMVKNETDRQGRDLTLDRYAESKAMVKRIPDLQVPPATLQIEVRADCNYRDLPTIRAFRNKISIANGLSAPKIIVAIGSDGKWYKQLFKSGNDDLRQDAIMEQVFDQVSRLLKNHTATRLRNIGIRTYKVLPLSTRSGLMEFVQDTIPLHQWLMPAHERYYPSDWKSDRCRKEIGACQSDQQSTRIKIWQKCAENFHVVMRYFLLERFQDPDEWFEKRLAYTRSTAAISILGHVLGLGDRHCHNILLDEKSGEVVHIDLGVSFEAGRVLPVPEVVPFRLTRDLVDAMGYTKTEGVFRRCCEFTMDTLREERESIMTLLNVLRYDPLVNWSVTPTKAKRMQEGQETNQANGARAGTVGPRGTPAPSGGPMNAAEEALQESNKKMEEQAGEAGRALSVVEKKLSKTLSTRATVNELIQTATDERNLAVLYCGWASYA